MFKLFHRSTQEFIPPLSERKYLDDSKVYIDRIQERAKTSRVLKVTNTHKLVRLLKSCDNEYRTSDEYDYVRVGTERANSFGRTNGMVTEDALGSPKDMEFTGQGCFDLLYLTDDYVTDHSNTQAFECLYHPYTHLNLLSPDGEWSGNMRGKYSIWKINVYVLLLKWKDFLRTQPKDENRSHAHFINRILVEPLAQIMDHSLMNKKQREYNLDDNDVYTGSPYHFFTKSELHRVRMYPQRTKSQQEILFTIPSLHEDGMLGTLETPEGIFFKHQKMVYALARLQAFEQIAIINRGRLPKGDRQTFIYFINRLRALNVEPNYKMLPREQMDYFFSEVDRLYSTYK